MLLAAVLWSISGLLVRLIDASVPTIIFWRSVFAIAVLCAYVYAGSPGRRRLWQPFRQLGGPGWLVAGCLAVDSLLFILAYDLTKVANAVLLFSTCPFFAALFAWWILRERVPARTWITMIVCTLGIAVMVSGSVGTGALLGDGLALCVAVLFAVTVVVIRKHPQIQMARRCWHRQ